MKKRSRYRPRPLLTDPLVLLRPANAQEKAAVMLNFLTALEAMARGDHPGENEWRSLSDAINTVEVLCLTMHKLIPCEVMPTVNAAIAAMVEAANRYKAGQRMGVSGPGLQALRDVVAIYGQCVDELTSHEMAEAQRLTQKRVHEILRAKKPNHEVIAL
jgi:hypothetical protein